MIYLDHAATTPMLPEVYEAMEPYLSEEYANPSAAYRFAKRSREAVEQVRSQIAEMLRARPQEIYFTSGGTESDNWALRCTMLSGHRGAGGHMITTAIEHHAILHTCEALEQAGISVSYLSVGKSGVVDVEEVKKQIREDTRLISVMFANNEIGTIQPIRGIGEVAKRKEILFHTDAVQAFGHVPLHVRHLGVSMLSASAHKLGGPKGVGFLYLAKECGECTWLYGGAQEMGRRAGTENVAGIVGLGAAAAHAERKMGEEARRIRMLRDRMLRSILSEIPDCAVNGSMIRRMPGNINIRFAGVEGSVLLVMLDAEGVCASAGSACTASSQKPSHVLKAIGLEDEEAFGSLRFTLGAETTKEDVDEAVRILKEAVAQCRAE